MCPRCKHFFASPPAVCGVKQPNSKIVEGTSPDIVEGECKMYVRMYECMFVCTLYVCMRVTGLSGCMDGLMNMCTCEFKLFLRKHAFMLVCVCACFLTSVHCTFLDCVGGMGQELQRQLEAKTQERAWVL